MNNECTYPPTPLLLAESPLTSLLALFLFFVHEGFIQPSDNSCSFILYFSYFYFLIAPKYLLIYLLNINNKFTRSELGS